MCESLCKSFGDSTCDDCGILVCYDVKSGDDLIRPAYVTESGDLKCSRCGPAYDEADEDAIEYGDWETDCGAGGV